MAFVPEGQHDSSQARSAWNHEENSTVPAGRLNRFQVRSGASNRKNVSTGIPDNDFDLRPSLRDKSHSPIEAPSFILALMGFTLG
jgi:hypothetical protein